MIINTRKTRKILVWIWTAPKCLFETFCTQEAQRCIDMNATLITFYLLKKIKQGFFLYYISYNKINVGKILKL
jgi:hypothetical protein